MRFSISDYSFSNSWLSRCLRCRSIGSVSRDWVGLHKLHSQKMRKCTETRNVLKYEKRHTSPADFHCLSRYAFSTYSFESDLILSNSISPDSYYHPRQHPVSIICRLILHDRQLPEVLPDWTASQEHRPHHRNSAMLHHPLHHKYP